MFTNRKFKILFTIAIGLAIATIGSILTWYQVSRSELTRTNIDAREAVAAVERLLDETYSAIELASPLLFRACTPETRASLSRLAIGIEHLRMINFFNQNQLACSSYDAADPGQEYITIGHIQTLILAMDDYISPGIPVIILRKNFNNHAITASIAAKWVADSLHELSGNRDLYLRVNGDMLTNNNSMVKPLPQENALSVASGRYPFSIVYAENEPVPFLTFLREGVLSLTLSFLLAATLSTVLWNLLFKPKSIREELMLAVDRGEIIPWYQPIIDANTGSVSGIEVLARWKKSDGQIIPPNSFIPVAEQSQMIVPLTRKLMEHAARELPALISHREGALHIAFNITHTHILETGFIAECLAFISAFPVDKVNLTVELSERESFNGSADMRKRLHGLHNHGIALALDDFGTGYANMEYLSEIPIDIIKIDRVFIKRIGQGHSAEQLLLSVIEMAKVLNMSIVAEGVETQEQADWLKEHGVGWLQGYIYSPPVPFAKLRDLL